MGSSDFAPASSPARRTGTRSRTGRRWLRSALALLLGVGLVQAVVVSVATAPADAAVGAGFELNRSDVRFILRQIKIAEEHARTLTPSNPCGSLVGPGEFQIPGTANGRELPWGLRTVDGSCNNLFAGREKFGAADTVFPRLVPVSLRSAEQGTSYQQVSGTVIDTQPRRISNLVVDQTVDNPAAVAAAGSEAVPDPDSGTLLIPNVAPDVGLSAPYNSVFTLFGQFFDHGLDLVTKGGGTIFMPLQPDDPLFVQGSQTNFMVLTRATNQPGPDGVLGTADDRHEHTNTTTPWVDQNQTYTSHPSHQVFLREFELNGAGDPVETGHLLEGPGAGLATWADVKQQSEDLLGIRLTDTDVLNVPLLATDPYGNFKRGPNGFPQLVTATGLVEGDPAANGDTGVPLPANVVRTGHAFLDDIAHHAIPLSRTGQPLAPDGDAGTTDDNDPATYDDEMLAAHFIAGDGRVNENIGLTSIHHVFHSEHNRLVEQVKDVVTTTDPTMLPEWQVAPGVWDGDRLFQAARFVNEMEYQHLVFEEFARKVQPMVNPFGEGGTGYNTEVNGAIRAEFAHAVYRFGHSMLTETVARRNANGSNNNVRLLQAFLNPPEFFDGGTAGTLTPRQAAGSVFRGMSRQVGNEIDEFVTEALRNNLLGLPLDLATINMARARDTGIPTLNEARRRFYAESNSTQVAPYESWADFAFNLKHRESLVNFIAAYGRHPSITGNIASRRAAADLLLNGPVGGADGVAGDQEPTTNTGTACTALNTPEGCNEGLDDQPADAFAFINSTDGWANQANGRTTTGVDDIDLWMGGLAEKQMVFGGLLGSTFNYVFEGQMEDLQDGDRFYYLSRTAGLNLLTALEGNSFAELVMRNTDVTGLPADAFSRPDYVFDVSALGSSGPVPDDPATDEWDESTMLTRMANGTIRYGGPAHVVFNGTDCPPAPDPCTAAADDRVWSSEGDDTIRGNGGNDWMQGGDGVDNLIGGLGNDIMNDLSGDDNLKGGPGNDALSSGPGFGGDLNQGGPGHDFVVGGNDATETFGGPGDDLVFAGAGEDTVFGDDGDDWIEGGRGPFNLLQGDNGAPFQDDLNEPGHDVLIGNGGEQDFDSEGGDDVMVMGAGIQRAEGMLGFDWTTHKNDPLPADSDMLFTALVPPTVENNRDRFDLVEALSGWQLDDVLRGDDRAEADLGTDHQLNQAGIDRVAGLAAIVGAGFNDGNILLGGAGSDLIEGRGGDDIIDGDRWLDVQLRAPDVTTTDPSDVIFVDTMAPLVGDVFAGRLDPGDIDIVRTIRTAAAGSSVDTAVFSESIDNYTITENPDGSTTVAHTGGSGADGVDTLWNIEEMQFAAGTTITVPGPVTNVVAVAGNGQATVSFTAPTDDGGSPITGFEVDVLEGGTVVRTVTGIAPTATSVVITGLTNGTPVTFRVVALNEVGSSPDSAESAPVTPTAPATLPGAPTIGTATAGNQSATVTWTAPADGGSALTEYRVQVRRGTNVVRTVLGVSPAATSTVVGGLTNGVAYNFRVRAVNSVGVGPLSAASNTVTPTATTTATRPTRPIIGTAAPGVAGGAITATANWTPPTSDGGSPITGYRVFALRMSATGTVLQTIRSAIQPASARSLQMTLPQLGNYRFQVVAINAIGTSPRSARSNLVAGR
ncbi:peroxidase family protein [Nocardioides sp. GCM10027113]|uniref:peroxidase family protein n=1 Tax=unclassified Nocardioides TaxID=2615069 RepID=UPI00360F101C